MPEEKVINAGMGSDIPNEQEKIVNLGGQVRFPEVSFQTAPLGDKTGVAGGGMSAEDIWNNTNPGKLKVPQLPLSSIYLGQRYASSRPYEAGLEESYAQQQGALEQWKNGAIKFVGTAANSFISGTAGIVYGLGAMARDKRFASLYDNEINRKLDNTYSQLEDYAPNYMTQKQTDANWYSPDYLLTANFFSDGILKNLGYSLGGLGGGVVWAKAIRAIGLTSKLTKAGKALEALSAVEKSMEAVPRLQKFAAFDGALTSIAQKYLATPGAAILRNSDRIITSATATFGEAGLESLQNLNSFRDDAIQKYRDLYGETPTGKDLDTINDYADKVGNFTWGLNSLLLTGTTYIQLPKILGSSRKADAALINQIEKSADGAWSQYLPKTRLGKIGSGIRNVGGLFISPSEGFEEGAQYAVQTGVNDYFNRAYRNKKDVSDFFSNVNNVMGNVFNYGVDEVLYSKEGMSNVLMGMLSGGLQQAGFVGSYTDEKGKTKFGFGKSGELGERGLFGTGGERGKNTQIAIDALNKTKLVDTLTDLSKYVGIGIGSQKARQAAIVANDKMTEKDMEHDFTMSYLMPRVKYGKVDSVYQELDNYRSQSINKEGFEELVSDGIVNPNETQQQFSMRIDKLETLAKQVDSLYSDVRERYSNLTDDEGNKLFTDTVLDKLVYAAAKVGHYDVRIPEVNSILINAGITNTSDVVDTIIKDNKPSKEAVKDVLEQINNIDAISDFKNDLKIALADLIDLSLSRKKFINEYDAIKNDPKQYDAMEETFDEDKEVTINQKSDEEKEGVQKKLEIGKEYSLKEPLRKDGSKLTMAPKISVLSQTLVGELEVKFPDGSIKFVTPDDLGEFDISDEDNTSQEMADILDNAIDTVLNTPEFADVKKELPTIGDGKKFNKLDWVNSLGDQKLIDAIEKEFDAQTKEIIEKKEKAEKEAEILKKKKEELKKEQDEIVKDSGTVGTNPPTEEAVVEEAEHEKRKIPNAEVLFLSTTSESEAPWFYIDNSGDSEIKEAPVHVTNSREFLNNVGRFPNKKNMRVILVTPALAESFGLKGIVQMSFRKPIDTPINDIPNVNSVDDGFIAQVFVEQVGDKLFYVDKSGKQIGEFGKQVDNITDVIFQTMRTTKLSYSDGRARYRKGQKEEAERFRDAWRIERTRILGLPAGSAPTVYGFNISRGIPKTGEVNNHISGVLIGTKDEERLLATDQTLIQIPTTGIVAHKTGQINMPNGRPVLVHGDNVEFLRNIRFSKERAEVIYEAINKIASEITEKANAGKKIVINKKLSRYLQNVLYWRKGKTESGSNHINISEDGSSISISGVTYSIPEISMKKAEIMNALQNAYHNVNNKTLSSEMFSKPFTEYYMENGELKNREWTNYQTYLLSSKYPDGSARPVSDTPLYTNIQKPTDAVPYTHEQKYSVLVGLELPIGAIAKPTATIEKKEAPKEEAPAADKTKFNYDGKTPNEGPVGNFGNVTFTVKQGEEPAFNQDSVEFLQVREKIIDYLKLKNPAFTEEELIGKANAFIEYSINKQILADLTPKEQPAAPVTLEKTKPVEEKYKGITIINTADIKTVTGEPGAAQYNRTENKILINRELLQKKFESKAWTKPRKQKDDSFATALPEDAFTTYDQWEKFVIDHEYQHSLLSFEESRVKTFGEYEDIINNRALGKEVKSFNPSKINKRGTMFRVAGAVDSSARMSERDLKAFKEWVAEKVPTIPYEVLNRMITMTNGKKAWGVFEDGVAKFVKGGLRGTEYHEIGEAIWNGMLSPEEQSAILTEERDRRGQFTDRESGKKYNYDDPTVSDQILKERIIDDFADYRMGKLPARNLKEAVRKFFKMIMDFFKSFVNKPSLKDELFKAIDAGKFKDKQLSAESKSMAPQYRAVAGLTEEQTNAYAQDMTAFAAAIIFGNGEIGNIDKSSLYNFRKLTSKEVFDKIEDLYTEQGIRQELGDVAWQELIVRTKQKLRSLLKIEFDEQDLVNINDADTNKNDYVKETFSVDFKKSAPMGIKFTSATLIERQPTSQEDKGSFDIPDAKVNPKTQTYSLIPYSRVFSTILDKLKNTSSIKMVVDKIVNLANQDGNYVSFFQRVGGDITNKTVDFKNFKMEDWRLFIEMVQTYTKQKPDAIVQYVSQGQVYSGSAMVTGIVNTTVKGWIQNMRDLAKEPDSYISYGDKTYTVSDLSGVKTETPEEKIDFLSKLGVIFPIEAWQKLKEPQQKEFTKAVSSIKTYLQDVKDVMSVRKKTLDVAGQYDTLATLLVSVTHPMQENTRINIDGKQTNSFTENNAPSVFENEFNEAKTLDELLTTRPELRDVYSKGSVILKKGGPFFDKDGNRTSLQLKVGYIEGTKNKDDNKGVTSVKLSVGERFTQEINQNLLGQYYIMIPADGSTEWMMNLGNHVSFEDIEQGSDGWNKIYKIFKGYLIDDINLALDADNRDKLLNLKGKTKDENGNERSRSKELRFFKDFLSEKTLNAINEMIDEGKPQEDILAYVDKNIDAINESVKDYIENTVEDTKKILRDNGQIVAVETKDDSEVYSYKMLNDTFTKAESINKNKLTQEEIDNILTFANANYIINNIEFHKILFGDPYQFKVKDGILDATKRFKSFLSPRRTTFDSPEFNTFLNEDYNKAGDIELSPEDPGYHEFKSWIDTVTVADIDVVGSVANMSNVSKEVRDAFAKTNEGDAASIMMDGTYRELNMKNGQWSEQAEKWHQWQMAYTRQNMPGYKYAENAKGEALRKHDETLMKTAQPEHVIEIIKPIVSGSVNGANNIQLVIDKTSQMPLYYSMVEGTNLEKLYTKMFNEKKGYIIAISGRKVGAENLHQLYKGGQFNEEPFNNNVEISWKSYGIQVPTIYERSTTTTRGSQITKLSTLDLFNNGTPIGSTPERQKQIEDAVTKNNELLDRLHQNGYERFLKKLGVEDLNNSYRIVDKRALAKALQDEMLRRELSDNVIDSVQLDENGEFPIPFEASPAYLQIKSILYSFVDKEITSPKMNGGGYVQAPVTMWEDSKKGRNIAIKTEQGYKKITRQEYDKLSEEEQKKVVLTDDTLKFYEDVDGKRYCEVMLPHWFKGKLGKHAKKSDKELIEFLNNDPEGRELLRGIGFRIPTQSLSSIEAFKVKGFLPQYMGKTVVVPSEITTKALSDFDIDKLNMYLKSVYIDKNGDIKLVRLKGSEEETKKFYANVFDQIIENKKIRKAELLETMQSISNDLDVSEELLNKYGALIDSLVEGLPDTSSLEEEVMAQLEELGDEEMQALLKEKFVDNMYRKALENEYYSSLEEIITMPENFQRLITPVSDDNLKQLSQELDELRGYDENKIKNRLLDRNYMTSLRHAFVTAKRWVGIAAVNITGHSLTQKFNAYIDPERYKNISKEDADILKRGGTEVLLDHNTTDVNGKKYVSLSGRLDADGKFISDGLSGYASAFVDVAKDPYILKIIQSDLVVGTFMFLRRIGVPRRQLALFMNQPMIQEYITMLDNAGIKTLFDSRYIQAIKSKFPSTVTNEALAGFNKNELADNIKKYYADSKKLDDYKNFEQANIFDEFLKYAKMAEYNFAFTQATNYDTTKFQSGDTLSLKQWRTEVAINKNIISSVKDLLEKTFIGKQAELLDKSMDALGEALPLEQPKFTSVTDEVLRPYAENKYLSKDKFDRIANKIKAAFLDYIIQKRSDVATNLQAQLVDEKTSVARMLLKAKQDFPGVQIINDLEIDSSGRVGGAQTIKLRVNEKLAYTENMYTGMMRELRDDPRTNELYKGIVRIAILQGTYQSPISIKNVIPVEDYAAHITPIIAGLEVDEDIRAFAESNEFQRNEWQDNDVVPIIEPTFEEEDQPETGEDLPRKFQGLFKTIRMFRGGVRRVPGYFPSIKQLGVNSQKRHLLFINSKYNAKVANYDVIKMPRAVSINKKDLNEGKIDVATGLEITNETYAEKIKKGDTSLQNYYGYKKVKYADGTPLVARYDEEGNPVYVYKFINLHGDGQYATEYYGDGRPSVFKNGSQKNLKEENGVKVSAEIPDQDIINFYGGVSVPVDQSDIITATIEKETENVVSSQSVTPMAQPVSEEIPVIYKDKEKRIRLEYPKEIEGVSSDLLVKLSNIKYENSPIADEDSLFKKDYDKIIENKYGKAAGIYVDEARTEITIEEAEFLRDNPEFANTFVEMFINNDVNMTTLQDYAKYLLDKNVKEIDTAQLSLFEIKPEGLPAINNNNKNNCG